jgi:hypothetical protein
MLKRIAVPLFLLSFSTLCVTAVLAIREHYVRKSADSALAGSKLRSPVSITFRETYMKSDGASSKDYVLYMRGDGAVAKSQSFEHSGKPVWQIVIPTISGAVDEMYDPLTNRVTTLAVKPKAASMYTRALPLVATPTSCMKVASDTGVYGLEGQIQSCTFGPDILGYATMRAVFTRDDIGRKRTTVSYLSPRLNWETLRSYTDIEGESYHFFSRETSKVELGNPDASVFRVPAGAILSKNSDLILDGLHARNVDCSKCERSIRSINETLFNTVAPIN